MLWNDHWRLEGQHAYLGASKHHWLNYDEEKLRRNFANHLKAQEGTELHDLAAILIKKRIKQVRNGLTFNTYVNDAIGFRMDVEIKMMYNEDFFGTADAIKVDFDAKILRIHDLKTGVHPGHMNQLLIYAALFFLEYGKLYKVKPADMETILRIYQNDEIIEWIPTPEEIQAAMDKGEHDAAIVKQMKEVVR